MKEKKTKLKAPKARNMVVNECTMHEMKTTHTYESTTAKVFTDEKDEALFWHWLGEYPLLPIDSDKKNEIAVCVLEKVADRVDSGEATKSELGYFQVLANIIQEYESKAFKTKKPMNPRELLKYLMELNELKQEDLIDEFGSQSRVSDFLNGKRDLSLKQIQGLAKRFRLSPAAFMPSRNSSRTR